MKTFSRIKPTEIDLSFITNHPVVTIMNFSAEKRCLEKILKRRLSVGENFPLRAKIPLRKTRLYRATVRSIRTDTKTGEARVTIGLEPESEGRLP